MLTDTAIRQAKPGKTQRKLFDGTGNGLYIVITPQGSRLWRMKYRDLAGRDRTFSIGSYEDVSLKEARRRAHEARVLIAAGGDPVQKKREQRQAAGDSFEALAEEWFETKKKAWADSYRRAIRSRLDSNILPYLRTRPIRDIAAPELLAVLRRIEKRGANETAHKALQICSQIFRFAVSSGRLVSDPARDLRGALEPVAERHYPAVIIPEKVGGLLRVLDGYEGSVVVKAALRLAPLVFVRPGELRQAEWSEIDLDSAKWIIPPWRMKMRQALLVPLSRQAVAILRELQPVTAAGRYVFTHGYAASRPMSENAVNAALRRCGIPREEMVGHGFRAMARTILDEVLHVRVDLIEHQLGHAVRDPLGRAYNRTSFLKERTEMMQLWADYLDELKAGKKVSEKRA